MNEKDPQTWRFTARPGRAEKVYLVVDSPTAPSRWIEMSRVADPGDATGGADAWSATADITPGRTRLRYFTVDDGTYLNCGSVGLVAERATDFDLVA